MEETKNNASMEKWCDHLRWDYIALAVLRVYLKNQDDSPNGIGPKSDQWVMHSKLRANITSRVMEEWCSITNLEWTRFPYSEDGVIQIYMRYRKRSKEEVREYQSELLRSVYGK